MKCRVCKKELSNGVGRYNDHILLVDPKIKAAICSDCATNNPDEHYKKFKKDSDIILKKIVQPKEPMRRLGAVLVEDDMIAKLCDCKECTLTHDACCDKYRSRLKAAFPLGEPYDIDGRIVVPIMDGFVPKKLLDFYTGSIIDRLKDVNRQRIIHPTETRRMLWDIEEMEDERRQLHIAILAAAGFTPFDVSRDAVAFKIVIEEYVTDRARKMGVIA